MYKIRLTAVASITAIITLAITVIGSQPIEKYSAELTIECENSEIHIDSIQYLSIKATIFNNGNELIKLVRPGDGSQGGLRTPIVNWSVIKSNNEQNENVKTNFLNANRASCGNINGLTEDDLLELKSGQTAEFSGWIGYPQIPKQIGEYRIRMSYLNEPKLKWKGLGFHDKRLMRKVKRTNYMELISNEILVEIKG